MRELAITGVYLFGTSAKVDIIPSAESQNNSTHPNSTGTKGGGQEKKRGFTKA